MTQFTSSSSSAAVAAVAAASKTTTTINQKWSSFKRKRRLWWRRWCSSSSSSCPSSSSTFDKGSDTKTFLSSFWNRSFPSSSQSSSQSDTPPSPLSICFLVLLFFTAAYLQYVSSVCDTQNDLLRVATPPITTRTTTTTSSSSTTSTATATASAIFKEEVFEDNPLYLEILDKYTDWRVREALRSAYYPPSPLPSKKDIGGIVSSSSISSSSSNNNNISFPRVAVLLQIGNTQVWGDMLMCTANVAAAAAAAKKVQSAKSVSSSTPVTPDNNNNLIDVYVTFLETNPDQLEWTTRIQSELESLPTVQNVVVKIVPNKGADVGQFLTQLHDIVTTTKKQYDVLLKMHTKSDPIWRERMVESLCGTPEQVHTILTTLTTDHQTKKNNHSDQNENNPIHMIAAQGTVFGPTTPNDHIFPHIVQKYKWGSKKKGEESNGSQHAFDPKTIDNINKLQTMIYPNEEPIPYNALQIVAGTCFWVTTTSLQPEVWVQQSNKYRTIMSLLSDGYVENHGIEHAIERWIPSRMVAKGYRIGQIVPAPRPVAMYFPQYHEFDENNRFWGKGFTEWTLLQPMVVNDDDNGTMMQPPIKKPLPIHQGGLGYYDLTSTKTRKRQGQLARAGGVNGFVYYHYWFNGIDAPTNHKVMYKVLEKRLEENEPNLPFMLSWANEPWTNRWNGKDGEVFLLSQEYGNKKDWKEHFDYLLPFFKHPDYIRVSGKPVFIIYRIGHVGKQLVQMMRLWKEWAKQAGLPGLYLVHTLGNFYKKEKETQEISMKADFEGVFHFWPMLRGSFFFRDKNITASTSDVQLIKNSNQVQYWGSYVGFDRRPRSRDARYNLHPPNVFHKALQNSFQAMSKQPSKTIGTNLYFLTAWNEWNEQAIMEPNNLDGFEYLNVLRNVLSNMPINTNSLA